MRSRPGHPYMAGAPLLFAHRGGAALAPENTMEAFRGAVHEWGADVLEMDVRLTADGELVVIHDETVDRTTDGRGPVRAYTLDELRRLDAGSSFRALDGGAPFRGKGVRVPLLSEVLEGFPDVRLNVEAKVLDAAPVLLRVIEAHGAADRVLAASAEEAGRADRLGYRGPVCATTRQVRLFYYLHRLPGGGPYTPRADALQIPDRWEGRAVASARLVEAAHAKNLPVHVWTVDEPAAMRRLLSWGVDAIQTDRPDLLARVLHEETGRPLPTGSRG